MSKERGTFLIELKDGRQIIVGNNYKTWWEHAREFIYYNTGDREAIKELGWQYRFVSDVVISVKYSNQQFYDDGGLKWCNIDAYQGIINDVCKKDKLAPVKVSDIVFADVPEYKAVLTKKLMEYR